MKKLRKTARNLAHKLNIIRVGIVAQQHCAHGLLVRWIHNDGIHGGAKLVADIIAEEWMDACLQQMTLLRTLVKEK